MPFAKRSSITSELDPKLQNKRRQIIEDERIRILGDALMLFYDKLIEKYELVHAEAEGIETEEILQVSREEVEEFARQYAATKPTGY